MKKFCSISFALVLSAALAAGCGGGGGDDDVDGGTDGSVVRLDGRVDARMADATVPGMCNTGSTGTKTIFQSCTGDAECVAGSQCLPLGTQGSFCFRCCDGTGIGPKQNDCDIGTACVQNGAPAFMPSFQVLENHCFFSSCGQGNGPGTLESDCEVGKDLWSAGTTGFQAGYCLTYDDVGNGTSGPLGACQPVGPIASGAACPLSGAPGTQQCVKGNVCIGQSGQTMGTCAPVCNPTDVANNGCPATGSKFCQDSSEKNSGTRTTVGTYGFCVTNQTCSVTATDPTSAAITTGGTTPSYGGCGTITTTLNGAQVPATCFPTTAARPNGLCGIPLGTATTMCKNSVPTGMMFALADFCAAGETCGDNADATTNASCMKFCGATAGMTPPATGANPGTGCPGAAPNCRPYIYDQGATAATTDDELALGYGVCKP